MANRENLDFRRPATVPVALAAHDIGHLTDRLATDPKADGTAEARRVIEFWTSRAVSEFGA
jgi:predicted HD phosphohydrolase